MIRKKRTVKNVDVIMDVSVNRCTEFCPKIHGYVCCYFCEIKCDAQCIELKEKIEYKDCKNRKKYD